MNQLNLLDFEPPMARRTDPVTSHMAAEAAVDLQSRHYRIILDCLRRHGRMGKDGISARCGLTAYQVSKRLTELERKGRIAASGNVVKSTAGRSEREWLAL